MSKALIIGNGLSRKNINLNNFKDHVKFGCNALYRDYPNIDYLIAIDAKIIQEIINSNFDKSKFIIPSIEDQYEPIEYNVNRPRNNAAMVAMKEAIKLGFTELDCIGLDFVLDEMYLNMGNVYSGTNAYGSETQTSYEDTINRCKFMDWFANKHYNIEFNFIFPQKFKLRHFWSKNINATFNI